MKSKPAEATADRFARLKVGEKSANKLEADIIMKEGDALVQRVIVERGTGFCRPSTS